MVYTTRKYRTLSQDAEKWQTNVQSKSMFADIDGEVIAEYKSLNEASRRTGVSVSNIYCCCIGKTTTAGGYQWKYKI